MSEHDEIRPLGNDQVSKAAISDPEYCEITNRILIVSPRPASLRSLVATLAEKCYDVLLLHHANDPLLSMVQGNIIIVDRTVEFPASTTFAWSNDDSSAVLALVNNCGQASSHPGEETVQWPGPIEEVIAKIQLLSANLKSVPEEETGTYVFKEISLDHTRMSVTRNGSKVDLTKTEYDLLRILMATGGKVLSRQELMNEVWGEQYFGGSNAVDVHIRSLRSKLGDDPKQPRYIATVRGAGYRLAD